MISLALVLPLMCWALVARTTKVGWIVAAVLAVCLATEIGLAKSWILPGERVTLLVALVLTTIMVLITGITVEGHHADARRLRSSGARIIAGLFASVAYCAISLIIVVFIVMLFIVDGRPASTPSSSKVLPLPVGLTAVANRDEGCSSGSETFCSRKLVVRSAMGLSEEDVAGRLRDHLAHTRGWHLNPDRQGDSNGCRVEGRLLDRQRLCLSILTGQNPVTVLLYAVDSW
jgi:hypothetical protein